VLVVTTVSRVASSCGAARAATTLIEAAKRELRLTMLTAVKVSWLAWIELAMILAVKW
jgi:hypothetical protein